MYNEVVLETLYQCIMFLLLSVGGFAVIFYLFYFIVQQIRFWRGMKKMSLKRFVEILFKNLEN